MNEFIGSKLKTLLEEAKMSIEELALKSNITTDQLLEILNNITNPSIQITVRICEALGIRVGTLLDGTDIQPISVVRHDETLSCNNSYSTTNR
ncbi:MAG: helix-turn-helix transcriptional regulator, partial [Rikenellaceae bacterium]